MAFCRCPCHKTSISQKRSTPPTNAFLQAQSNLAPRRSIRRWDVLSDQSLLQKKMIRKLLFTLPLLLAACAPSIQPTTAQTQVVPTSVPTETPDLEAKYITQYTIK